MAMTLEDFAKLAVLSGLLTAEREAAIRAECSPESLVGYVQYLVAHGYLTDFQCEKLLVGKYKGFFHANYKLLRHLDDGPGYTRFEAEDTTTGATAILRFFPGPRIRYVVDPPDDGMPIPN